MLRFKRLDIHTTQGFAGELTRDRSCELLDR